MSHAAGHPAPHTLGLHGHVEQKPEESEANIDGGSIIANNIISDFGYGNAHWIWGDTGHPILLEHGQIPSNPPLHDVVIQGNIVYDTGRDEILVDGKPTVAPPRYTYAVWISPENTADALKTPVGLHFSNNLLHPGSAGISNVELKP